MENLLLNCVEVTCKDGIQYGIQVFGEEAIALYNATMKIVQDTMNMDDHKVTLPL